MAWNRTTRGCNTCKDHTEAGMQGSHGSRTARDPISQYISLLACAFALKTNLTQAESEIIRCPAADCVDVSQGPVTSIMADDSQLAQATQPLSFSEFLERMKDPQAANLVRLIKK